MRCFWLSALALLLLVGAVQSEEISPTDLPIESFVLLETDDINSRILSATEAGNDWPYDPVSVAIEFLGTTDYRYLNIERKDDQKSPAKTVVTIIRGGFQDDSVWGNWEQLYLSKNESGAWEVHEARRAWRCYRGHQTNSFGKRLCM